MTATLFDTSIAEELPEPRMSKAAVTTATKNELNERHWNPAKLDMHPAQPRDVFTQRDLVDLRLQMESESQLVDMICRPHPDEKKANAGWLQLCSGDRRRKAALLDLPLKSLDEDQRERAKALKLKKLEPWKAVRVSVRPLSDAEAIDVVFSDFKSSRGLDVLEIANSLHWLTTEGGYSIQEAADIWRMDRALASRRLTLNGLPDNWKEHARGDGNPENALSGKVLIAIAEYRDCPPVMEELEKTFRRDRTQFETGKKVEDCADAIITRIGRPVADGAMSWWPSPVDHSAALFDFKPHKADLDVHRIPFTHELAGTTRRKIGEVAFNTKLAERLQTEAWNKANPDSAVEVSESDDGGDDTPFEADEPAAADDGTQTEGAPSPKQSANGKKSTASKTADKKKTAAEEKEAQQKRAEAVEKKVDEWVTRLLGFYVADNFLKENWDSDKAAKVMLSLLVSSAAAKNRQFELVGDLLEESGITRRGATDEMLLSPMNSRKKYTVILAQVIVKFFFNGWDSHPTNATPKILDHIASTFGFDLATQWERIQTYHSEQSEEFNALYSFLKNFNGSELESLAKEMGIQRGELKLLENATGKSGKIEWIMGHNNILKVPDCVKKAHARIAK